MFEAGRLISKNERANTEVLNSSVLRGLVCRQDGTLCDWLRNATHHAFVIHGEDALNLLHTSWVSWTMNRIHRGHGASRRRGDHIFLQNTKPVPLPERKTLRPGTFLGSFSLLVRLHPNQQIVYGCPESSAPIPFRQNPSFNKHV